MSGPGPSSRLLVVIPAWNEQEALPAVIAEVRSTRPECDVLVVDDGSADATATVAAAAGARVCQLPFNIGVGGAMRAGYRYAWRNGYDVVAQIDADGQHDPAYLATMLDHLDRADVVVGARFAGEGSYPVRGPRRWAMRLLSGVLSRLAGTPLTDVTSGMRVSNRRAIQVFATHYPAEYLGDTVESMVIALRTGCRVAQVPVAMRSRAGGRASHSPAKSAVYLVRAMVALALALVRRWPTSFELPPEEAA